MKYRTILMFGAPGSGKGTHGKILGTIPGFVHCSCGEVFRNLNPETPLGKIFVEYSSRGQLVPDEPTIELWQQHAHGLTATGRFHPKQDTLVLDGIPRNVHQAEMLEKFVNVIAVFYMCSGSFKNLVARMQRRALKDNRLDDANIEVIRARLKTYERETKPVINFYGKKLIHRINTDGTPPQTFSKVLRQVVKL
ncbi:MAG TPA: nucleoside monophosphate kinase [Candidatus Saccharimonadales bacterium]|nr:nucleoside monophosphate kinase [Candidatus Saccharimonadales bacterium]